MLTTAFTALCTLRHRRERYGFMDAHFENYISFLCQDFELPINNMELITHLLNAPIVVITLIVMIIFKFSPPKKMNAWYGYRTANSMKSKEHWDLAQKLCADSGIFHMSVLLVIQIAAFLFTDGNTLTLNGLLILWVLSIVVIIVGVEKKLKQLE